MKLQFPSYGQDEIDEVNKCLDSTFITMGERNKLFERLWNEWLGSQYSSSCNSGSSANLLIFSSLMSKLFYNHLNVGDNVIVPSTSWSTTYFPIIQAGLNCNVVDIDLNTLNIDIDKIEDSITPETKAICCVHLVGNPCNMDKIQELCKKHNLILIEDNCEGVGAKWGDKKTGTFGLASSTSFMFAHHLATSEGGMISSSDSMFDDIVRIKRAHGWLRDIKNKDLIEQYKKENPEIDSMFLFVDDGYNFRMCDILASFGIHQIKKIDTFVQIRRRNHFYMLNRLREEKLSDYFYLVYEDKPAKLSPFSFTFVCKEPNMRERILKAFTANGIEHRGIAGGNITKQPFIKHYSDKFIVKNECKNSEYVKNNGFWVGNNQHLTEIDYEKVIKIIKDLI